MWLGALETLMDFIKGLVDDRNIIIRLVTQVVRVSKTVLVRLYISSTSPYHAVYPYLINILLS